MVLHRSEQNRAGRGEVGSTVKVRLHVGQMDATTSEDRIDIDINPVKSLGRMGQRRRTSSENQEKVVRGATKTVYSAAHSGFGRAGTG